MKFHWEDTGRSPEFVRFGLNQAGNFSRYRHLSFRMTQVFDLEENPAGKDVQIQIVLETTAGETAVDIADFGGDLHFPVRFQWDPPVGDTPEAARLGSSAVFVLAAVWSVVMGGLVW